MALRKKHVVLCSIWVLLMFIALSFTRSSPEIDVEDHHIPHSSLSGQVPSDLTSIRNVPQVPVSAPTAPSPVQPSNSASHPAKRTVASLNLTELLGPFRFGRGQLSTNPSTSRRLSQQPLPYAHNITIPEVVRTIQTLVWQKQNVRVPSTAVFELMDALDTLCHAPDQTYETTECTKSAEVAKTTILRLLGFGPSPGLVKALHDRLDSVLRAAVPLPSNNNPSKPGVLVFLGPSRDETTAALVPWFERETSASAKCLVDCELTRDRKDANASQVLLFNLAGFDGELLARRRSGQSTVGFLLDWTTEMSALRSAADFDAVISEYMDEIPGDYKPTVRYNIPVPVWTPGPDFFGRAAFWQPINPAQMLKTRQIKIIYIEQCDIISPHNRYIQELKKHFEVVEKRIACVESQQHADARRDRKPSPQLMVVNHTIVELKTTDENESADDELERSQKELSEYVFSLAFESRVHPIPPMLFRSFAVGTIPLYRGDQLIYSYLPHHDSIINTNHYISITHLVSYLKRIIADPRQLDRHLQWRNRPNMMDERFARALRVQAMSPLCRVCVWAASKKDPLAPLTGDEQGKTWEVPLEPASQSVDPGQFSRLRVR